MAAPRCLLVQHVEAEPGYQLAVDVAACGVEVDVRRVDAGDELPADTTGLAGLVLLGGPAAAWRDDAFPTRGDELALLEMALATGLPTLGICLGAQLLAVAAGGRAEQAAAGPEVGWAAVQLTEQAGADPLLAGLPPRWEVLHWHADTVTLPAAAVLLASSGRYPVQAFRVGEAAWGLQFHLELDESGVAALCAAAPGDAEQAGTSEAEVMAATEGALVRLAPVRDAVFARFAALVLSW